MSVNLQKTTKKAAEIVLSLPASTRIRLISHYDADGISAAAIISKALYRAVSYTHLTLPTN